MLAQNLILVKFSIFWFICKPEKIRQPYFCKNLMPIVINGSNQ